MKNYFILKRKGFFASDAPSLSMDWCGSAKRSHFNYEVTVVCPDQDQKIVVYHENIADQIGSPQGTCEMMAKEICRIVDELLVNEGVQYNLIHVRIQPHIVEGGVPAAYMQYVSARRPDDLKLIALV